jgi:hypothetical protein
LEEKKMKKFVFYVACFSLLLCVTAVNAVNYNAVKSGDWSDPSVWSPSGPPASNSNATVSAGYVVNVNVSAGADSVSIGTNGDDGKLYLNTPGVVLTATSAFYGGASYRAYVEQSAGTLQTFTFCLGQNDLYHAAGYYKLTGGASINSSGHFYVGKSGQGQLTMGDATSGGVINIASGKELLLRQNLGTTWHNENCLIQGWGTINMNGPIETKGRIIANGWGNDRTLDASHFTSYLVAENLPYATQTCYGTAGYVKNTGIDGWYAVNKGKLALPSITVGAGSNGYNWGETASDAVIDMINSIHLGFNGATGGVLNISLLASDRSELAGTTGNILGVWDFQAVGNILGSGTASLTFRYDHALADALGVNQNDLCVYHYVNGQWLNMGGVVDTTNKLITAANVNSFSLFAVGTNIVPEPATIALFSIGILTLVRKRYGA